MKKFWLAAVTLIMCVIIGSSQVMASLGDLKDRQKEQNAKIKTARDLLKDTQAKKSDLLNEVALLDAELDDCEADLEIITNELMKTEAILNITEAELEHAQTERDVQYELMRERLVFLYEQGNISYIEVILNSKDFFDFLNRVEFINSIMEYDRTMAENLSAIEQDISQKLEDTNRQRLEIQVLSSQQQLRKRELETALTEKDEILLKLTENEHTFEQQLSELETEGTQIANQIKAAEAEIERQAKLKAQQEAAARAAAAASNPYTGGVMQWPVSGIYQITSNYGNRTNPISRRKEFHTGVDLKANMGTPILAANDGTVLSAGYRSGYGYTVVVSHGGGISTLYAHNSKLVVSAGDKVSRGQTIAKAGSTGYSTGPHLHFEVRVNGDTVDPMKYLK